MENMWHSFCVVLRNFLMVRIFLFLYKLEVVKRSLQSLSKGSSENMKCGDILTLTRMSNWTMECKMVLFAFYWKIWIDWSTIENLKTIQWNCSNASDQMMRIPLGQGNFSSTALFPVKMSQINQTRNATWV